MKKMSDSDSLLRRILMSENSTSTKMADLPPSRCHRKLPAELNCQIFYCLNLPTRRKFILGLGWDFYAMFRHRLLTKTKRIGNPHGNFWNRTNTRAIIAADGLTAFNKNGEHSKVSAVLPFPISGPQCRMDEFPGTVLYYYEVTGNWGDVCLSDGAFPVWIGLDTNSYSIQACLSFYECWYDGEIHQLEPQGVIEPTRKSNGMNVFGCGLVLDPEDNWAIFFTLNGKLMGEKIPISPTVDRLFPAVTMMRSEPIQANFGDDPAKPFDYDINDCPGLGLACI